MAHVAVPTRKQAALKLNYICSVTARWNILFYPISIWNGAEKAAMLSENPAKVQCAAFILAVDVCFSLAPPPPLVLSLS